MTVREPVNSFLYTLFGMRKPEGHLYKLFIILFHIVVWGFFLMIPLLIYPVRISDKWFFIRELTDKLILVSIFYINYYWLIPKLFEKKKYARFAGITLLVFLIYFVQHAAIRMQTRPRPLKDTTVVVAGLSDNIDTANGLRRSKEVSEFPVLNHNSSLPVPMAFRMGDGTFFGIPRPFFAGVVNHTISSFAMILLLAGFVRLASSFLKSQDEKKALDNARLNAEVKFLKSQINPHFLFNTLNTIYAQAHARSEKTEFSILKLSELLRYMLYESSDERVLLQKDLQYISHYIDLQKLRLSSKVQVNYQVHGKAGDQQIVPLLLIGLVENAFKHGVSYSHASTIAIAVRIEGNCLNFSVTNPILESTKEQTGGIGLRNIIRRLELLYAQAHSLNVMKSAGSYHVNLKIYL